MPFQEIDIGSAINAGDGEAIRNAFAKVNSMLAEVYDFLSPNGFDPDFLAENSLLNSKLATMPANSVKANLIGSPASPDNVSYAALKSALGIAPNVAILAAAYTIVAADIGKVFIATGTWTLGLTAAGTVGNGFSFYLKNAGTGIVTIDPASTETIEAQSTLALPPKAEALIVCDGANWQVIGLQAQIPLASGIVAPGTSQVPIPLLAGYASYRLVLRHFEPATPAGLLARFATDGVPNFITTGYRTSSPGLTQNNTSNNQANGGSVAGAMLITSAQLSAAGWVMTSDLLINPGGLSRNSGFVGTSQFFVATNGHVYQGVANSADFSARVTHMQLYYTATTIAAGEWELYGLRK